MKRYIHTLRNPRGIHVRPAGRIAKLAREFADTAIVFSCNGKESSAASVMKLMGLRARQGAVLTITAEGANEDTAILAMSRFVNNNL